MEINKVKIEYLRKLKANNFTDSESIDIDLSKDFGEEEIKQAYDWIIKNDWFEKIGDDFKLNANGRQALEKIENENEKKNKTDLEISYKDLNKRRWDRVIDNGQKIINVIFGLCLVILTGIQIGKSSDIRELQAKVSKDSLLFSTTLHSHQNQLIQHDSTLEKSKIYFLKYDSLVKSLKVNKRTKKK